MDDRVGERLADGQRDLPGVIEAGLGRERHDRLAQASDD